MIALLCLTIMAQWASVTIQHMERAQSMANGITMMTSQFLW